mgnify:CR=1 FL=1|jgi:hypothetical protein
MIIDSAKKFWTFILGLLVVGFSYMRGVSKLINMLFRRNSK